jgi:hypothetical protein
MLRFSDGVEFETSGEYRIERRHDGLYVVGHGMLLAVNDRAEGQKMIDGFKEVRCNGCGYAGTTNRCKVTHHDDTTDEVLYCDECLELARGDWNGETKSVERRA